jgi:hypothetical protein
MPPRKKSDPKAEAIAKLTALAGDEAQPLTVREAAARALLQALLPKEAAPNPKGNDDHLDSILEQLKGARKLTPEERQQEQRADLTARLHRAAGQGDEEHCARIAAIFRQNNWSVPSYQLAPRPQITIETQVRERAKEIQETAEEALRTQLDWQAHHPHYRAGDRQSVPQLREWSGDW